MLRVDQVHVIRHKVLVDGRSQRQVAKEFGISRVTVRKYVEGAEPVRREAGPRVRPVWEPRWTVEIPQFVDGPNPAFIRQRPRPVSSTSVPPRCASRCAPLSASYAVHI